MIRASADLFQGPLARRRRGQRALWPSGKSLRAGPSLDGGALWQESTGGALWQEGPAVLARGPRRPASGASPLLVRSAGAARSPGRTGWPEEARRVGRRLDVGCGMVGSPVLVWLLLSWRLEHAMFGLCDSLRYVVGHVTWRAATARCGAAGAGARRGAAHDEPLRHRLVLPAARARQAPREGAGAVY
jgi:hypothetical protein